MWGEDLKINEIDWEICWKRWVINEICRDERREGSKECKKREDNEKRKG